MIIWVKTCYNRIKAAFNVSIRNTSVLQYVFTKYITVIFVQLYFFVTVIVKLSLLNINSHEEDVAIYFTKNKMYAIFLAEACIIDDYIIKYYSFLNPNKGPA